MTSPAIPAKNAAARAYNAYNLASFTIGAELANVINVAVQLKDARGNVLPAGTVVDVYLASDVSGQPITPTAPTSTLAIGTRGSILAALVTDKMLRIATDSQGRFDINITQTATPTYYLVVMLPDGFIVVSGAITFA